MAYDHNLPATLNPTGDYCVPLFIPHDPDYTALLLGVIGTLEDISRYERDPDFDDEDAKIVVAQWRDRTITPLIEAIASATACGGGVKTTVITKALGADRSTTSVTYVNVTGSDIAHTFTKPNAVIRCHNIAMNNTNAAQSTLVQPAADGLTATTTARGETRGTTATYHTCIAVFENIPAATSTTIRLKFAVSGSTGNISSIIQLVWEIQEYD